MAVTALHGEYDLGPGRVEVEIRLQAKGATVAAIPPFGSVEAATHRAPIAIVVSPTEVDPRAAQLLVESQPTQQDLEAALHEDLEAALKNFVLLLAGAGLLAGLAIAAVFRVQRWEWAAALVAGVMAPVGLYGAAFADYDPEAFREPTLSGALSRSPELLGPVQQFGERFNKLRGELDEIGSLTFQLYQLLAEQSPIPPDAVRLLHISDLHLNPVGYDVALQVARRFEVDAVIDSGDVTAEGTALETSFVERIADFDVPYYFVRGNHDSEITERAVASMANARILDGNGAVAAGVRLFGVGDPLFTPDKTVEQPGSADQRRVKLAYSRTVEELVASANPPPDVVIVHDAITATRLAGKVPLVLHGHTHIWSDVEEEGTRILGVGSTGGAGLKSLAPSSDIPMALQVLYLDRREQVLLGFDRIEVSGPNQQFLLKRFVTPPPEEPGTTGPSPGSRPAAGDQARPGEEEGSSPGARTPEPGTAPLPPEP